MHHGLYHFHAVILDCGHLETPSNGDTVFADTIENSTANYTCAIGYNLVGTTIRTCLSSGFWTGSMPYCDREYNNASRITLIFWYACLNTWVLNTVRLYH